MSEPLNQPLLDLHFNRRWFLKAGSIALGALGLTNVGLPSRAFAQTGKISDLTLGVATYRGEYSSFTEEAGTANTPYKVEYAEFAGGNLIVEALASGSLDVGAMSEIPPIFSIQSHRQPRLIAVLQGDVNNQAVLIPKDSTVESVGQLRGKRVGYVRSTTSHYFLIKALKEQGLTLKDITPVALTPQDGFNAFQSGQLDAWVIYGLFIQLAKFRSGARVLKTAQGYLSGNYLIAARPSALEDPLHRQAIQDYLQRQARTLEWIDNNPEPWAAKSAQLLGVDKSLFLDVYNTRSQASKIIEVNDQAIASQQEVADVFFDAGVLSERLDVSPLWDKHFPLLAL